ncbi:MAG: DegV family protein [Clostridiales bacterium]|jgi:DegV family protein with EDD domain|nr:DegV family protein [Clostridiales bacterium]
MSDYVIVSDATLDLPLNIIEKYDIKVIPMGFDIDGVSYNHYPDEREITVEDFYNKLKNGAVSHTTQITPATFIDYFTEILNQGLDILYIAFSSGLSGTYNTAQMVIQDLKEEYPQRKIYCIDSLCASIGEGLLVLNAAMQKQKGLNLEELKDWVENNKLASRHWFTVKDLFYLKRGGRVTSIEAVVGSALRIRPVLSTDDAGKLVVISKIRGSRAELDLMVNKLTSEGIHTEEQTVIIGHGDNLEQAKELENILRTRNLVKDVIISSIGPIIGTHTGPGMLALVYMGKKGN